jgi:hypothetical protein
MVRYAVGYESRAYVTFGPAIRFSDYDPHSRRDVLHLAHRIRDSIGRLHKVLPTAIVAAAMRPSISRRQLEDRAAAVIEALRAGGANLLVTQPARAVTEGAALLAARNVIVIERGSRFRVRDRTVLRYYARTIQHLIASRKSATH